MGWWWSSSKGAEARATPSKPHDLELETSPPPQTPTTSPPAPTSHQAESPKQLTRDQQADLDLHDLLQQLSSEPPSSSPRTSTRPSPSSPDPTPSRSSISPDSLYPTTMSCRQAFDSAWYCQLPGGQFMSVYRYGEIRDCREHWSAFWFCMRSRSYSGEEKAARVQDYYRRRAVKYKVGPSSEDVWEVRTTPVVDAFNGDPDA